MRARAWQILVVVLAVAWAVGLRLAVRRHAASTRAADDDEDEGWKQKAQAAVDLLPPLAPPADGVGRFELDLDARTVVALFRAKRTEELRRALEAAENAYEGDVSKERDLELAWSGFKMISDLPALDAWVSTTPGSFVGPVARASAHLAKAAWQEPATCTDNKRQLTEETRKHLSLARVDLERALEIRPTITAAHALILRSYVIEGSPAPRSLLDRALRACPACVGPRAQYILTLRPDVVGMRGFAEESQALVGENPRLRVLLGYGDHEDCKRLAAEKQYVAALASCDRAIAEYPAADFLRDQASAQFRMSLYDDSVATLTTLLAEDRYDVDALVDRAHSYARLDDSAKVAADLRLALQLAPANDQAVRLLAWLLKWLDYNAAKFERSGELAEAAEYYGFAARLVPEHRDFDHAHRAIAARIGSSKMTASR